MALEMIASRYQIVKSVSGGMGIVYFCVDLMEDAFPVALKTFRSEYLPDRKARDRFLKEATIWVHLGFHPNIVQAYRVEYTRDEREVYIVSQFIPTPPGMDDPSLRSRINLLRILSVDQALLYALGIARGMKCATSKMPDLVHRDLKPENVLIGMDNQARVCDFGLANSLIGLTLSDNLERGAKISDDSQKTVPAERIEGTPLYMSPEQWQNQRVDARTDIYAWGCILFEMLTGEFAAVGEDWDTLARAHLTATPLRRMYESNIPSSFKKVLGRCLPLEISQRYANWEEVESNTLSLYRELFNADAPALESAIEVSRFGQIQRAESYLAIGASYMDIGNYTTCRGYFQKAIEIALREQDRPVAAAALANLGYVTMKEGETQQALRVYASALEASKPLGSPINESILLGNIGEAYHRLTDLKRARDYYLAALKLAQEVNSPALIANQIGNLGILAADGGEFNVAIEYYMQAIAIFQEIGNVGRVAANLGNLGNVYMSMRDYQRAQECLERSLLTASQIGDIQMEGAMLGNLGICYASAGNLSKAEESFEKAATIAEQIGDQLTEGINLSSLGQVRVQQRHFSTASIAYKRAIVLAEHIANKKLQCVAHDGLAQAYSGLNQIELAIECFHKSLKLSRELQDDLSSARTLGNLGNTLIQEGDFQQASVVLKEAIALSTKLGLGDVLARVVWSLGMMYELAGDRREAIKLMEESIELMSSLRMPEFQQFRAYLLELKSKKQR